MGQMSWMIIPLRSCFLGFLLLSAPQPGSSWYKHSASPRYHTVGRASGLLIGVRRSPYLWKRDSFPFSLQGTEEGEGVNHRLWEDAGTEHQLYPDPGENRILEEKLQTEIMKKALEEERGLKAKGTIHDETSRKPGGWMKYKGLAEERSLGGQIWKTKHLGNEERSLEKQSWVTKYPGDEEKSLGGQGWVTKYPGDEKRSLGEQSWMTRHPEEEGNLGDQSWFIKHPEDEEGSLEGQNLVTMPLGEKERILGAHPFFIKEQGENKRTVESNWVTKQPSDVARSMENGHSVVARTPDREEKAPQEESGQRRRSSGMDILSMLLKMHLQAASRYLPWRTQTRADNQSQVLYPKSKTAKQISCDDFTMTFQKALCQGNLRLLSHSQSQPGKAEA